jgi:hypothetical protein
VDIRDGVPRILADRLDDGDDRGVRRGRRDDRRSR